MQLRLRDVGCYIGKIVMSFLMERCCEIFVQYKKTRKEMIMLRNVCEETTLLLLLLNRR